MPAYRSRDPNLRPLEVTTTGIHPMPESTIISPTPRAPTIPTNITHYPPPPSTFEHDPRRSFPPPLTPPPLMRSQSPVSASSSTSIHQSPPAPAPKTYKRRRSNSEVDQHRPKKGDEDYVKRPENAFILFRRKCVEERQQLLQEEISSSAEGSSVPKKQRQAELSKLISQQWKGLSTDDRNYWEDLAKQKKKEHEEMYPGYVYRPQRTKDKDKRNKKGKGLRAEVEVEEEMEEDVSYSLPVPGCPTRHSRSHSAPSPPTPYYPLPPPPHMPPYYYPPAPTSPPECAAPMSRRPSYAETIPEWMPQPADMPPIFGYPDASISLPQSVYEPQSQPTLTVQCDGHWMQQFNMPQDPSVLLPPHEILSPSLTPSSGSTSPSHGPVTPISIYSPAFPNAREPYVASMQESHMGNKEGYIADSFPQDPQYPVCSWQDASVWASGPNIFFGEDFDVNAIPPIELGLPKFGEELDQSASIPSPYPMDEPTYPTMPNQGEYPTEIGSAQDPFAGLFAGLENGMTHRY
ncbi:hypothetical protein JAAARDRAFT_209433 [Jaapia argillacea MUCL 33604]|uniref:HMG box domain-containing protein n=1 Tax=Jaapia argillacea MUCL 33604 TaxID=933084 RepID=A0A067PVF9_9AGAM|nr:hypothetical protein JAAARDRAFT_209433 [Jaapia argillacea MUCL 33604]